MCLRVAILYPKTGRVEVKGWEVSEPNSEGMKRFTPAAEAASKRRLWPRSPSLPTVMVLTGLDFPPPEQLLEHR
jgi:hypothetical protein